MKALYVNLLMAAGLVFASGCNMSPSGGVPGETGSSFKLKGPSNTPETTVKQGERITKDITIDPGKNFKEDVALETKVDPADGGVTASVEPPIWKASESKKIELRVQAAEKAKEGEYTIHVTGKPTKGNTTTLDVKVKVPAKK
jgi:uncharacterized membrane protein